MDRAAGSTRVNRDPFDFKTPLSAGATDAVDPLFGAIVRTRAFRRLAGIRFLGGIDYLRVPSPNGRPGSRRYTRYQHSLGVTRLALLYCDMRQIGGAERRLLGLAALLHDIGHAPLSHSLESLFKAEFGIDHHVASERLITGRVPLGRPIHDLLRANRVDTERLAALIAGQETGHDGFFAGPVNLDTIEGILRTQTYEKPAPRTVSPETVTAAATRRAGEADRIAVDEFWSYKDMVYRFIINAEAGVLADAACQAFMRRHLAAFRPEDVYGSEEQTLLKMPGLRRLLSGPGFVHRVMDHIGGPVRFKARRFTIDPAGDFFARQDAIRYRQNRTDSRILPRAPVGNDDPCVPWDLFDDHAGD